MISNDHTQSHIQWYTRKFNELSLPMLYDILQLRNEVFVVEQNALYQDADGKDLNTETLHVMAYNKQRLDAYLRVMAPNTSYVNNASIGRVVVRKSERGISLGHSLISKAISICSEHWSDKDIKISAQAHLKGFYESHSFKCISQTSYMEDGIPHVAMVKSHRDNTP